MHLLQVFSNSIKSKNICEVDGYKINEFNNSHSIPLSVPDCTVLKIVCNLSGVYKYTFYRLYLFFEVHIMHSTVQTSTNRYLLYELSFKNTRIVP